MPDNPKVSIAEFAQRIKSKYPQYKDVNDTLLTQKMVAHYPQYKGMVEMGETPQPAPQQTAPHDEAKSYPAAAWQQPPVQNNVPNPVQTQPANGKVSTDDKALAAMFPAQKAVTDNAHVAENRALQNDAAILKFDKGVKEAATTVATARLKAQGKVATPKGLDEEMNKVKADLKSGKLSVNRAEDGTVALGAPAGFWDGVTQNIANTVHNLKYAPALVKAHIEGDNKGLADIAEEMAKEKAYINNHPYRSLGNLFNSSPMAAADFMVKSNTAKDEGEKQLSYNSSMGTLGQTVGGGVANLAPLLIPGAGEAEAGTSALLQQLAANTPRMVTATAQTYATTVPERFLANYQENKANGLSPEQAAGKAAKDAEIQGILPAVAGGAFFSGAFGGGAAAKGFGEALGHAVKSGAKFSAIMGAQAGAEGLVKQLQGYKVNYGEDISEAMKGGFFQTAAMHLLPHVASLPSYAKSQLYNYLNKNVERPVLDAQLQHLPEDQANELVNDLQTFDKAKQSIPDTVPLKEETKAAIAGKIIQRDNLNKQIADLNKHGDAFAGKVEELKKQAANIETDINQMATTNKPFDYERDNLTGEPLSEKKGYEALSDKEKEGIVVPKEYGTAEVIETGKDDNKGYRPYASINRQEGGIVFKDRITAPSEKFADKAEAQAAADKALAQHYYENGMYDNLKPIAKESESGKSTQQIDGKNETSTSALGKNTQSNEEAPIKQTDTASPQPVPAEEGQPAEAGVNQESQPTEKEQAPINEPTDTGATSPTESIIPEKTPLPEGQVPQSGVQPATGATGQGDAATPPPVLNEGNAGGEKEFTKIDQKSLQQDYGFVKKFDSKSDQSVANATMQRLQERADSNSIPIEQQAANEVAAMSSKTGEASEHDIVTAAYHLMNLDERIANAKDELTEGLLLQQREAALTTLRQLGNNAGRNLRLFSVAFKKAAEGTIETTRRQWRRDLGVEELPKTTAELDKNTTLTAADKKKVRPYVQTIEQLEKDLKDIKKKGEATVKDIEDKELQAAIKKAYEQGRKEAQATTGGKGKKNSDKLRAFASKIRNSETLDKLGLGKSAAGDAQANGFSFNAKEALAKALELMADGLDKAEAIAKALKESGGKASKEFNDLMDTALAKLSLRDKDEVINDIKALARQDKATTITPEMVQHNLIHDFVKQHLFSDTPYDTVIKEATKELQEYLPDVDEKTVADAFVKRGAFKEPTKQQVQTELKAKEADVKRLALTEIKLRALEAANDIHEINNHPTMSAAEKKKAAEARKSEYEKEVDAKIKAFEDKKAALAEAAKQAKADYQKMETERNRQLQKVADLKEKIANYQKGIRPESTKAAPEPDVPEIEALKKQAKEAEKNLNAIESEQRKQLRKSLSTQDAIYSLEQEAARVKNEKTIFARAIKNVDKAGEALKAARKAMEQAYSEAGIRPERQNNNEIQIYKAAEEEINKIQHNPDLSDEVKAEHIAQIKTNRDTQLHLTKQGVLINLRTSLDDKVADLATRIQTAKDDGDTATAQQVGDLHKDLQDLSTRLKPNGENLKDQVDKAEQDLNALIKSSKGTPIAGELEDMHKAFVADWQKSYDELQRQLLMKQQQSKLRSIQRRFAGGSYSQIESTPFDIQRDKVLAEQDAQIKKAYTKLNAMSEMAKKDSRSFGDKALDMRKQWMVATFSAIEKVAGSAVTKPLIDAGNKQTFGRLSGAITGIKPVELGMVKDTFRQMKNSESAAKFMASRNNAYVDALVNYEKAKGTPHEAQALQAMQTAELKHAASLAYLFLNAGSHIDIKQIMVNAATDLDASLAKYNKKYPSEMGKWEKVGYWLESVNRTHGAMKSVSARQALMDGYIENLQYFQKQGEPLDADTRSKAWDMAAGNEYEQGRFSEATSTSNSVAKLKSHESKWVRYPANFLIPVSKISINITKQGLDRAMPLEVMYRTLGKDALAGMKINAEDGIEFKNFASKYYNGIKRGFNELPLQQKKYINTLMARGMAGLAQYALVGFMLSSGAIKYGGAYNDNDPFKKKYGQVIGDDGLPLKNGEWEFGGHRAPKLLNAIINHSPYSLPASLAADIHQQVVRPDGKGNGAKVIGQVLNETYQRLPFATAVDLVKGTVFGDEYKLERTVANTAPSARGAAELLDKDPQTGEARKVDTKGENFFETVWKMVEANTPGLRNTLDTKATGGSSGGSARPTRPSVSRPTRSTRR